jgi:TRAP-type C4-dicarboxylate transport system permease small subunit
MNSKIVFMIGPIGFVLTAIASLVSLWAYFEKVVSP